MTCATLTSWNDDPPGRPSLTPPASKTLVTPGRAEPAGAAKAGLPRRTRARGAPSDLSLGVNGKNLILTTGASQRCLGTACEAQKLGAAGAFE